MCLAVPGKVKKISGKTAIIDFSGITRQASIDLTPKVKYGDYVLVHAGFVIQILNKNAAKETIKLFRSL